MDHDKHPGAQALQRWREAAGLTQATFGSLIVPPVKQSAVARWEDSTSQRPMLSAAVQIQRASNGVVSATLWGYSQEEVDAVMGVAPAASPATHEAA